MTGSAQLVWLASYPKSGNTWIRSLLAAYRLPDPADFQLSAISQPVNPLSRTSFAEALGVSASLLRTAEITELLPFFYRALNRQLDRPTLVKTHLAWQSTAAGQPIFDRSHSRSVVLIVRNPLAVAPSLAHHMRIDLDTAIVRMSQTDLTLAASPTSIRPQLPQLVGSWSRHTETWLDQAELPMLLLRYEDALADPHATFTRLLHFLDLAVDPSKLSAAIEATRFHRLQQAEHVHGFGEAVPGRDFFRRGSHDAWRTELSTAQQRAITAAHESMMARLGYPG